MLSFDQTATDRACYDTILLPLDVGQPPDIHVERIAVKDDKGQDVPPIEVCALRIITPNRVDLYINDLRQKEVGPPNGRAKVAGRLATDARTALVRLDEAGEAQAASAVGATFLKLNGKAVWRP